jgi:hypothetical protein
VSLQVEQLLCREEKQCVLSDRIIQNGPQNENQQIAKPFFSSLLEAPLHQRPLVGVSFEVESSGIGAPATAGRATLA